MAGSRKACNFTPCTASKVLSACRVKSVPVPGQADGGAGQEAAARPAAVPVLTIAAQQRKCGGERGRATGLLHCRAGLQYGSNVVDCSTEAI